MTFQLSQHQINFFETFGYLKLPGLFKEDVAKLEALFEAAFALRTAEIIDWRPQAPRFKNRTTMLQFIERDPEFCSLLDDPRIDNIFASLCGADYAFRGSEGNIFDCGTSWHSDSYGALFKYQNVRIAFYLDDVDADSGALRFIPGSHYMGQSFANKLTGYLEDGDTFERDLGLDDRDIPSAVLASKPGDVLVFNYAIKHAAFYEGNARRMFTLWASECMPTEDIEIIRKGLKLTAKLGYREYYGPELVATATPPRMRHLAQFKDLQFDDLLQDETDDSYSKDWQFRS